MAAYDRDKMREGLRKTHIQWLKRHLLENPLPSKDYDYWDSEWHKWLDRIEKGKTTELQYLDNIPDDLPDDVVDMYAEDVAYADAISNDMYAAMCVHIWSRFERTFRYCVKAWNLEATSEAIIDTHRIKEVAQVFSNTVQMPLNGIMKHEYVNAIRVLSNCYKHSNGRYEPGDDQFPIASSLLTQWEIEEGHRIDYLALPLKDILFQCGLFLEDLLGQFRNKIENPH